MKHFKLFCIIFIITFRLVNAQKFTVVYKTGSPQNPNFNIEDSTSHPNTGYRNFLFANIINYDKSFCGYSRTRKNKLLDILNPSINKDSLDIKNDIWEKAFTQNFKTCKSHFFNKNVLPQYRLVETYPTKKNNWIITNKSKQIDGYKAFLAYKIDKDSFIVSKVWYTKNNDISLDFNQLQGIIVEEFDASNMSYQKAISINYFAQPIIKY